MLTDSREDPLTDGLVAGRLLFHRDTVKLDGALAAGIERRTMSLRAILCARTDSPYGHTGADADRDRIRLGASLEGEVAFPRAGGLTRDFDGVFRRAGSECELDISGDGDVAPREQQRKGERK